MSAYSVPVALDKFSTFGDLLRYLRRRMGLTQRELSIAVGYSDAQISRLEQNQRLPDLPTVAARFVSALGLNDEPTVVARLMELATSIRREDAPAAGLPPFKGLRYFDESDADIFFGRTALTTKLHTHLTALLSERCSPRLLAVVGASGSGKSSVIRAGLVPGLRWEPDSANWPSLILTPGTHPLESLAASLTPESQPFAAQAQLVDQLARNPYSLHRAIQQIAQNTNADRLCLIVDQFEELFTHCRNDAERKAFVGNLFTAAREPDGLAVVVIALRADFYAQCADFTDLREALVCQQEYIGPLNTTELRQAIEEPARCGGWDLEPGLVDLVLHDLNASENHSPEPGALPLVSHALLKPYCANGRACASGCVRVKPTYAYNANSRKLPKNGRKPNRMRASYLRARA
jgi:transcriptional regulator with XRE-family HTH domain